MLHWLVALLTAPLGFIAALIVALLIELFSGGQWIIAAIFALFFIGMVLFEHVTDRIFDPLFNRVFRIPEEDENTRKQDSRRSRYAFLAGFTVGMVASWVWSASQILDWF